MKIDKVLLIVAGSVIGYITVKQLNAIGKDPVNADIGFLAGVWDRFPNNFITFIFLLRHLLTSFVGVLVSLTILRLYLSD